MGLMALAVVMLLIDAAVPMPSRASLNRAATPTPLRASCPPHAPLLASCPSGAPLLASAPPRRLCWQVPHPTRVCWQVRWGWLLQLPSCHAWWQHTL